MRRLKFLFTSAVVIYSISSTQAAITVVGYDVGSNGTSLAVADNGPNISGLDLTRGSGLTETGTTSFNSNSFDTANTSAADALADGDYLQFGFTVAEGSQVDLTDLNVRYDRSGTGPSQLEIRVSTDGFVSNSTTVFTDNSVSESGENSTGISLSALGSLTGTVTFRVLPFGASSSVGTFDFENHGGIGTDRGILVNGSVSLTAVPEPEEYALAAGLALVGFAIVRRRRVSATV